MLDFSQTGSSVVLFVLIALTPVCHFHLSAASLCCCFVVVGTRGSTEIRNSRGRIFELNSFHLGQDCPQSSLNLTPSIWVKCPHLPDVVLPSGASFGHVVLNLDPSIWLCFIWGKFVLWLELLIQECGFNVY